MLLFNVDEFYDKNKEKATVGKHNPEPVTRRRFRRKTTGDFDLQFGSKQLTQVGGYPILERAHRHIELRRKLSRGLHKPRGANGFTSAEISHWLVDQKLLGCRRLDHGDQFREDPILEEHYGVRQLPSDSTVGRYLRGFDEQDNEKLSGVVDGMSQQVFEEMEPKFAREEERKEPRDADSPEPHEVVLDFDGSELTVYGKQEQARRGYSHRKKDTRQYRMLVAVVAGVEWWLDVRLLPGNQTLSGQGEACVESAQKRLPEGYQVGGIRGDSALYSGEDIKRWAEEGYVLGISAPLHKPLKRAIGALDEEDWVRYETEEGELIAEVAQIEYQPEEWGHGPYRYILTRRRRDSRAHDQRELFNLDPEYDYFAYLTTHEGERREAYEYVVKRCNVESCIKESKIGFDAQEVPHGEFEANVAYLQHVQIAYNEKVMMDLLSLPKTEERVRRERLVREIILVPGLMLRKGSRWLVSLVEWWPWKKQVKKAWKTGMPAPAI